MSGVGSLDDDIDIDIVSEPEVLSDLLDNDIIPHALIPTLHICREELLLLCNHIVSNEKRKVSFSLGLPKGLKVTPLRFEHEDTGATRQECTDINRELRAIQARADAQQASFLADQTQHILDRQMTSTKDTIVSRVITLWDTAIDIATGVPTDHIVMVRDLLNKILKHMSASWFKSTLDQKIAKSKMQSLNRELAKARMHQVRENVLRAHSRDPSSVHKDKWTHELIPLRRSRARQQQAILRNVLRQPEARSRFPVVSKFHDLDPGRPLPFHKERVLSLGLNFAPTDIHASLQRWDVSKLMRKIQWQLAFHQSSTSSTKLMPTLGVRSMKDPPDWTKAQTSAMSFRLLHAINALDEDAPRTLHPYVDIIKSIRNDPTVVICKADKNLGLVKMSPTQYHDMCMAFLNQVHLVHISPKEIVQATHAAVFKWLASANELNIDFEPYWFILKGTATCVKLPEFYALAKIHKGPPLRPRPIVAAFNAPTSKVSIWLSHMLIPVTQRLQFYLRDSSHLIDVIKDRVFPENARLYIGDVEAMYPNMRRAKTVQATNFCLEQVYACHRKPSWTKMVASAIQLLYNFNYFTYRKGTHVYLQSEGIAMGSNASAPLSDLYLYEEEFTFIKPAVDRGDLFYVRFRDDMCAICTPETFEHVLKPFTEAIKPMKVIWEPGARQVAFLDVEIAIRPGHTPRFSTYRKDKSNHSYLPPFSTHPPHTKVSWVFGELIRLHRTNSTKSLFLEQVRKLVAALRQRGYGQQLINQAVNRWKAISPSPASFPGPTTALAKLPLVGNGAMPHKQAPPMVVTIPSEPLIHKSLLPIIWREYRALQRIIPALPTPIACFTTGRKLGSHLSNK